MYDNADVLISMHGKWIELEAQGLKSLEIRKSRPKIQTPFKCFVYNTKDAIKHYYYDEYNQLQVELVPTKVVGEFICDSIDEFYVYENGTVQYWNALSLEKSCLSYDEIAKYIGRNHYGYAWHIKDFKVYDKPRELSEFFYECNGNCFTKNDRCIKVQQRKDDVWAKCNRLLPVTNAPQSWRYVAKQ